MKISTEMNSPAKSVGEERAIEYIAKAGFDAWDFSLFKLGPYDWEAKTIKQIDHPLCNGDYLAFARKLKKIGEDNGIYCNQSHAPFPVYCKEIRDLLKRAIECTAEAGGKICVVHPDNYKSAEENAQMYFELLPFAKDHGVKIATENMWNWNKETDRASFAACATAQDFVAHIQAVNDPYLVACLDLGHAEMMGEMTSAVEMIEALGDSLQALHIHDNDKWHDSHQIPFTMDLDFDPMVRALKKIGYKGEFTLESCYYLDQQSPEETLAGLCKMADAAKKLAKMFEEA